MRLAWVVVGGATLSLALGLRYAETAEPENRDRLSGVAAPNTGELHRRTSAAARAAVRVQARLLALEVPSANGQPATEIDSRMAGLLADLKERLGAFTTAWLAEHPGEAASKDLAERLGDALAQEGARLISNEPPETDEGLVFTYGLLHGIDARPLDDPAPLLGVAFTLGVPCGEDAVLFLFERTEGGVREAARVEQDSYENVGDALGTFRWVVVPADDNGWAVVSASISPWCASNWQGLRWRASRRDASGMAVPAGGGEDSIYLEGGLRDENLTLERGGTRAVLTYVSSALDPGLHSREYRRRLEVRGGRLVQIGSAATDPRGFVHEWLLAEWDVARTWTDPWAVDAIGVHEELSGPDRPLAEHGCLLSDAPEERGRRWAVEVFFTLGAEQQGDGGLEPDADTWRLFFLVRKGRGDFVMEDVVEDLPSGTAWINRSGSPCAED